MSWSFAQATNETLVWCPAFARTVHLRTGEKTKWVPVPPEELQFERPNRTQHQRPRPPQTDRNSRPPGGPSGAPSTSSGQGSQQQSRAQSSAGMRPPPSHTGSVSHSQAQSRTGSVHSSPRHASIRGGGRRLPDEGGAPPFGASRSMRSSGPNSPAAFAQPQPLPPQEFIPGVRSFISTNGGQGGWDPSLLSTIPDSGAPDMPPPGPFYPPPGPPLGMSPYHSPQPAGSPAPNPYAQPPMVYAGQPGIPQPVHAPGYGTPPYPMYPPYSYGYPQPYMYWPPPNGPPPPPPPQSMPSGSPAMNPVHPGDLGIPPPTLMARPPPPNESEAVAGYRDVAATLPAVEENRAQQNGGQSSERGRRIRELNFGSIALQGTQSPSPAPGSPNTGAGSVSGGADRVSVPADEQSGEDKADGKTFAVFSIGVAPGETGPARLRSRTHSKGPATTVSAGGEGEQSGTSIADAVAVLVDVASKALDLTDPTTKWEFGTTNSVEELAGDRTEDAAPSTTNDAQTVDVLSHHPSISAAPFVPMGAHYGAPPFVPPVIIPGAPVNGMPSATSPVFTPRHPASATEADEWAVRDYGFGFGRGGPPGAGQPSEYPPRDDRSFRERRDFQPQGPDTFGRPRRGSYGQQGGFDRGGFGGRRGRGLSGGYGGRGYSNRVYSGGRGGYANQAHQRQPPYAPPPPPPPPPQPEVNYYAPPITPLTTYLPSPYEPYPYAPFPPPAPPPQMAGLQSSAPLPVPLTPIYFPIDSTRYYLLGQLEYYLSVDNMTLDYFLRQQMDSHGWIPIPLIASFNRVRTLTTDLQVVTDALTLSSLVEVRDGYVRMTQWDKFVLPTAHKSSVEPDQYYEGSQVDQALLAPAGPEGAELEAPVEHPVTNEAHDVEEEEEEDVEFVL
ncbi:uncharacterized protein TRAVEDRAFT_49962 [Trametes versicolor FP-101664 SS1]|uniref:uncharacterized protein n=1 Tax=Trametes versicolor (strain FP-101664) TaxID=717944 RepID=UPI0004621572|nr:uncharacterized protein TRAVEDRAFT_49962 [Trametes versicolor FP-101664 SS1]EIW55472.1 hypothetical protein TRAVEDRAFT_49962 [Trametes versicolor FP-101664 SS1]